MSEPRPAAAPVWYRRAALTTDELLAESLETVTRLRWVLEVTLTRALPAHVDPSDLVALSVFLHTLPAPEPLPDPADELHAILARGRAERVSPTKAWVPCDGVQPRRVARWVEVHLEVPVRAAG